MPSSLRPDPEVVRLILHATAEGSVTWPHLLVRRTWKWVPVSLHVPHGQTVPDGKELAVYHSNPGVGPTQWDTDRGEATTHISV